MDSAPGPCSTARWKPRTSRNKLRACCENKKATLTKGGRGLLLFPPHYLRELLRELLAIDNAVFHHEGYFLQGGDVVEGISRDGDDVGEVAGLQRSDLVGPLQELRAVDGAGLDGGQRRHAKFHHQHEFAALGAMRERADVGAHGDGDSG